MQRQDFHYELPPELIAQHPPERREASRLLVLDGGGPRHRHFDELPELLAPGDLLMVNDTRVIRARLRAVKDSGGQAELLVERLLDDCPEEALCQVRVSKALQAGRHLDSAAGRLEVLARDGDFYRLRFPGPVLELLDRYGEVPLPPYIERTPEAEDLDRYQTVWSRNPGAVAAPTAGLHFSPALLERLDARGVARTSVTLHIGAGTFQPMRVDDVSAHRMHSERYAVPPAAAEAIAACRDRGGRVVAVGTTVVRTLEAVAAEAGEVVPASGETELFITPGFPFRAVDLLITNFHLPESTLLMLVCAFAGTEPVLAAYREAVRERYRFFSYGDAMLLERAP